MNRAELAAPARRALRRYLFRVTSETSAAAAAREAVRVLDALSELASSSLDGATATVRGLPVGLRRHYVHPFHVYYERQPWGLLVFRLHHHARRPLER